MLLRLICIEQLNICTTDMLKSSFASFNHYRSTDSRTPLRVHTMVVSNVYIYIIWLKMIVYPLKKSDVTEELMFYKIGVISEPDYIYIYIYIYIWYW